MPTAQELKETVEEADRLVARLAQLEALIAAAADSDASELIVHDQFVAVRSRDGSLVQISLTPLAERAAAAVLGELKSAVLRTREHLHDLSALLQFPRENQE